ncbi:MAG: hypothetical protein MUE50_00075 [Pirellulaceae bacterium]|jgi:hypothetical protein|nr:hypothetical protein [Pirellulaceae bacterium]
MSQTGIDWTLYRNTGTRATPVWSLVKDAQDVTCALTKQMADVSRKVSKYKRNKGSLKDGPIEFGYVYQGGDDAHLLAFLDSFVHDTNIELAVCDGPIEADGAFGYRAFVECSDFPINQPLVEGVTLALKFALGDYEEDGVAIEPDFIGWSGDDSSSSASP